MVNTVFKGDLAEVSWGKETGLRLEGDNTANGWAVAAHATLPNTSVITFGSTAYFHTQNIPDNALVGCLLRITGGANFTSDDYASTRRVYYITANDCTANTINVQPAMATTATADTGDIFTIDSVGCPTFDTDSTDAAQKVKSDQFLGLLNTFSLPEPEIDVRKQHVVGMGRDVNVLTSGRETLAGGSMELNAHTIKWMKYALGGWTSKSEGEFSTVDDLSSSTLLTELPLNAKHGTPITASFAVKKYRTNDLPQAIPSLNSASLTLGSLPSLPGGADGVTVLLGGASAGALHATTITLSSAYTSCNEEAGSDGGIFKTMDANGVPLLGYYGAAGGTALTNCLDIDAGAVAAASGIAGNPVYLCGAVQADVAAGDFHITIGSGLGARFSVGDYVQIFDKDTHSIPGADATLPTVNKHEIRRVLAIDTDTLYVEEPFLFDHTHESCGVERLQYQYSATTVDTTKDGRRGTPMIGADGALHHGVEHTLFGHTNVPTFMIEQSFRQTDASPGREQMLRLFNGCKVQSAKLAADSEGECKLTVEYEATRHYTDTGDVFTPHRMFENTANSFVNRLVSGIAVDGEKPYLFQNLSVEAFGKPVLRGTQFEFGIANQNTTRWYVRGFEGQTADTDQVQHGGTHQPLDITEAAREYTFTFSAIIEDDRYWNEMRTRKHHQNSNDIVFRLNKSGAAATRQSTVITLEDYTIMKANHPMPDDKGPITAEIECAVRHLKVVETNPYFTL